ncbi:MAG: hypothetical protein AAGD43_00095 [Pseudomonadota bacterium]
MMSITQIHQRIEPLSKVRFEQRISSKKNSSEKREYQLMFGFMFIYFVLLGLLTVLLPNKMRPFNGSATNRFSILSNARRAAHEITPFMFMR